MTVREFLTYPALIMFFLGVLLSTWVHTLLHSAKATVTA